MGGGAVLQEFHFEATVVLTGFKIDGKGNFDVGTVGEADGIGRQVISALPAAYAGIHAPVLDFPSYCKVSGSQIPGLEGA